MKIAITGGTGYIGTSLISKAVEAGHDVILLGRKCHREYGSLEIIDFDIDKHPQAICTFNADVIIHLAMRSLNELTITNIPDIEAAKFLASLSSKINAKFIYLSSQTADVNTISTYGKTKWTIEREIKKIGGLIIRPGQVYGGDRRGLFGKIVSHVKNSTFLPKIIPAPLVQPIHIDDLINGILNVIERPRLKNGVLNLGSEVPIPFDVFLKEIAKTYLGVRRIYIPIPAFLIRIISKFIKSNNLRQVISLLNLKTMETSKSIRLLDLNLRNITDALNSNQTVRRRKLLQEAQTVLKYVSKRTTPNSLKSYVRNIELNGNGKNLNIPICFFHMPILFSIIDNFNYKKNYHLIDFFWRLNCAIRISEASIEGAKIFMGHSHQDSYIQLIWGVLSATMGSLFWILIGFILQPIIRLYIFLNLKKKIYG